MSVSKPCLFFKTGFFSKVEEQVAYSQHKFDSSWEECILSTTLGFPGDMSHRYVLALDVPDFS